MMRNEFGSEGCLLALPIVGLECFARETSGKAI